MRIETLIKDRISDLIITLSKIPDSEAVKQKFVRGTLKLNGHLYKLLTGIDDGGYTAYEKSRFNNALTYSCNNFKHSENPSENKRQNSIYNQPED